MSVTVTVRGAFSVLRPPERATIFFAVSVERPHQQAAYAAAADSASIVSGRLLEQLDPERGPVTSWSSDQVRTWASRPWNNEGTQLPPVHHAQVNFQATFSDFGRLSDWVGSTSEVVGLTIDRVEWSLSEANRDTLTREVRVAAVRDARDKAQTYADALCWASCAWSRWPIRGCSGAVTAYPALPSRCGWPAPACRPQTRRSLSSRRMSRCRQSWMPASRSTESTGRTRRNE